ncbi:uncharacterized protein LOC143257741 [Tachypleus tridentatus]|uniref:uncharacterized protein LOC143257741 n=1 Tax=Tachypleus tridentatus TaxID=6853 RepID=UPI003FD2F4F9
MLFVNQCVSIISVVICVPDCEAVSLFVKAIIFTASFSTVISVVYLLPLQGTSVVPETLCLDSPLLEVSQFNLCADHLRPDRADWIGQCHSDYEEELQDKHEEGADGYQVMDEFMDRSVYSDDL